MKKAEDKVAKLCLNDLLLADVYASTTTSDCTSP